MYIVEDNDLDNLLDKALEEIDAEEKNEVRVNENGVNEVRVNENGVNEIGVNEESPIFEKMVSDLMQKIEELNKKIDELERIDLVH